MRRLITNFAIVAAVIFVIFVWRAPWTSLGILAASHALLLYATLRPNAQWLGPVITCFATDSRELWLTIDDGPTEDTPAILDLLDARGVPATFFVKGSLAAKNPESIRAMIARGHSVGNHSQTHPSGSFWCLSPARIASEIDRCNESLRVITGAPPTLFRAPVGMKNPFVHPALSARGLMLTGWSIRAFDAVLRDASAIARRTETALHPGAILVLHQGRPWSLETIDAVIASAVRNGYTFIVPELSRLKTKR